PSREFYVSPTGSGDGSSVSSPMSFHAAIQQAKEGDWYWMLEGTYKDFYRIIEDGKASKPIVFRNYANGRARIDGNIQVEGEYNWLWGLEVDNLYGITNDVGDGENIGMFRRGIRIINCIVHDGSSTFGSWNFPEQVIYGNIIYRGYHSIYTQNTYSNGVKYFVHNISMDAFTDSGNGPYEFHAYGEGGDVSGLYLEGNVFANTDLEGKSLIGGKNDTPNDHMTLIGNYFYGSHAQLGYARPVQAVFKDNKLYKASLRWRYFWGDGNERFPNPPPAVVTGNTFYQPDGGDPHVQFQTSTYKACSDPKGYCREDGTSKIRPDDVWDQNTYLPNFRADFHANNQNIEGMTSLSQWQNATQSAGKMFDSNSTVTAMPTQPMVAVLPNAYEPGRAHVVIFNFAKASTTAVDLSPAVGQGKTYRVMAVKDAFGTPVAQGTYNGGTVNIPTPSEFGVFLVLSD
ncbi:MAG TPA: chondroitinase-B domain-containing protein, partial [Polyangiaceae bacterium]|nr:chondroitinase-B domain-containing protein [Polyangiaceae bacterium]